MESVYFVESARARALDKILGEEPLLKDSFSTVGFTIKDGNAVGLGAGKYVLYFSCQDAEVTARLKERLSRVEGGVTEVTGAEKEKVIAAIRAGEDAAAGGFGAIFG
ncbi:hypothetical protein HY995_06055 [Candidatus Micrarchaeota archaeon]|nr:hypothetical protein [Candidatus Micrarchaeota archaeon]MBI5177617.1 hypothetical protein [Candidatus Micrarchaeota archaeon]